MGFNRAHRAQRFIVLPLAHPFDININIGTALQHERMRSRSLALSATLALVLLPSQLPAAALPLMRTEWSASSAELGWVVSAYLLGYAAAVLVVLPLTDRVRPSRVIAIGALVTALAKLGFAFAAHDVITASALRVIAGFGLAGVYMPGVRLVAQSSDPARRGRAVGLYVAAFYLGGSLSFLATGLLLGPFGWRGAAFILGAIGLAALPVAAISSRGIPETTGERAHLDLRVLRNAPLVRTITAYVGHSWELFIVRAWLAAFLAAAFALRGLSPTDASAQALQAVAGFGIGSLGPVVAGVTLDLGAGWVGPFVVAGVVGIATALPLALVFRERPLIRFERT